MNIGVWLSYDGTRYDGWQKQGNTDRTIQGKLEAVLEKLEGSPVEVHGSGRTDAGVHAEGQVANFHLVKRMEPDAILDYMNRYLPEDIAVTRACVMPERFHSRLNAARKTYRYQIETASKKNVFERHYYYGLGQELDVGKMEQAAAILTGTHDYKSFCGNKKMKKSTIRTIESICFQRMGSRIHISFTGNGFLAADGTDFIRHPYRGGIGQAKAGGNGPTSWRPGTALSLVLPPRLKGYSWKMWSMVI